MCKVLRLSSEYGAWFMPFGYRNSGWVMLYVYWMTRGGMQYTDRIQVDWMFRCLKCAKHTDSCLVAVWLDTAVQRVTTGILPLWCWLDGCMHKAWIGTWILARRLVKGSWSYEGWMDWECERLVCGRVNVWHWSRVIEYGLYRLRMYYARGTWFDSSIAMTVWLDSRMCDELLYMDD